MPLKVAVVLAPVLAALAAFVALRPSEFRVARSRTIAAPPDVAHAFVNDFHTWREWSPFERLDPAMKRELSGPPAGPGATYHWTGNASVGEGRLTITDSHAPRSVTIRLEFIKPWASTATARFDFAPSGSGTNVTWTMTGRNNLLEKAICLFMDTEAMIGSDFERGLANLDAATAASAEMADAITSAS
jgi:hypothetical protein